MFVCVFGVVGLIKSGSSVASVLLACGVADGKAAAFLRRAEHRGVVGGSVWGQSRLRTLDIASDGYSRKYVNACLAIMQQLPRGGYLGPHHTVVLIEDVAFLVKREDVC